MSFGKMAKEKRISAEVSLRKVADALGFTPAYISDIERGNRNAPSPEVARIWAETLGADPEIFENLAILDRDVVTLEVDDSADSARSEAALALHRLWPSLDEETYREIIRVVRDRENR